MDVVIIPAGVPRKPGMTRDDLFNTNASIVRDLVKAIGKNSPKALIGIISNPVSFIILPLIHSGMTEINTGNMSSGQQHCSDRCRNVEEVERLRSKPIIWNYHFGYRTSEHLHRRS